MKYFEADWSAFLAQAAAWGKRPRETRERLLRLRRGGTYPPIQIGEELDELTEARILRSQPRGNVCLHEEFFEASRLLRGMHRAPVPTTAELHQLSDYLTEHFSNDEVIGLLDSLQPVGYYGWNHRALLAPLLASASHIRSFLETKNPTDWEKQRFPDTRGYSQVIEREPLLTNKSAVSELRALLSVLSSRIEPLPIAELPARLPKLSRPGLGRAILAGLRHALIFATLDDELTPVLTLWPSVARRLSRAPAPAPKPVEPESTQLVSWAIEDLVQLLVRAAEPMRVTTQGTLFAKARRELEQALQPLPAWLEDTPLASSVTTERRIDDALALAVEHGFAGVVGQVGKNLSLEVTAEGFAWLEHDEHDRWAEILKQQRIDGCLTAKQDDPIFEESYDDPPLGPSQVPRSPLAYYEAYCPDPSKIILPLVEAFASLEPGRPIPADTFLSYHIETTPPPGLGELTVGDGYRGPTEEECEALWGELLVATLERTLLPFGGLRIGIAKGHGLTLELTSVGRYLVGRTPNFELPQTDAPTGDPPVRLGPDFEVLFLAPSASFEAAYGRFAERLGTGIGRLFRITKNSILTAANAGLGLDTILETMTRSSPKAPPKNVVHEVRSWYLSCRRLHLEPTELLRCPDIETADRVFAAGGRYLDRISETVLALKAPTSRAALMKACKKAGLFVTQALEEAPPPRQRKRRRRW